MIRSGSRRQDAATAVFKPRNARSDGVCLRRGLLRLRETARTQRGGGCRGDDANPKGFIQFQFSVVMVGPRSGRSGDAANTTGAPFHPA